MKLKLHVLGLISALMLFTPMSQAAKLAQQNLKQLIEHSESILSGHVASVSDGISEQGVPYTEVTIKVNSAAKGTYAKDSNYTFRQFGLLKPRTLEDGKKLMMVTPEGFPRWNKDESVIVFMYKAAKQTGLRTTAGMAHGKFTIQGGKLTNEFNNYGIFDNIEFADGVLTETEQRMLTTQGAVSAADFMSLVGKAVSQQWITNGKMK